MQPGSPLLAKPVLLYTLLFLLTGWPGPGYSQQDTFGHQVLVDSVYTYDAGREQPYAYVVREDNTVYQPLPEAAHRELIEDLDYNGEPEKEEPEEEDVFGNWLDGLFDDWNLGPLQLGPTATVIILIILALGLGYFIYNFLGMPPIFRSKAETEAGRVDITEIQEDQLTLSETESLLQRAEKNEQYDLAVRLQYLALLKRLHEMEVIRFARDKVNRHYLREVDAFPGLSPAFRKLTLNFERNWYGRYPIDRLTYRLIADSYTDFHAKLNRQQKTMDNAV